jgi:long-chain acyl-CoA synthetase
MVTACLAANAGARPDATALVHDAERLTHAELLDRVERVAHGLAAEGVGPGDAVALILPNGPAFVTAFLAVAGIGAVVVPLNPQFKNDEREFCLWACDARTVIAGEDEVEQLAEYPPRPLAPRFPGEPFVFQFSSGSTGRPKRLARTHGQMWAEAESFSWIDPDDRLFCAIPLFHTYGMGCCLLAAVRQGATLVFLDDPHPFILRRGRALEVLERERITIFPACLSGRSTGAPRPAS